MNTCARCEYFRCFYGQQKGHCFGTPPVTFASGFTATPPEVKQDRPACALFKPLPDDQPTQVKTKADLETPGDAMKQKRDEQLKAALKPGGKSGKK